MPTDILKCSQVWK